MLSKILVVEDDQDINGIITYILAEQGHIVTAVYSCAGLAERLLATAPHSESLQPDLILLDINLPGMPGNEFCKYLKRNDGVKHIPVILLSANIDIEKIKGECGAEDSIRKPFDLSTFETTVKKYLRSA